MNARHSATSTRAARGRKRDWIRPLVFVLLVVALAVASRFLPVTDWMNRFLLWVRGIGIWGPIALGAAYIVATVLFVPGFILTLGAGALFGVVIGSITVSISSTLGATAAFLIGRYVARETVAAHIARYPAFNSIDKAVAQDGWKIVGLVRLSPVFPYNLINYAFGLTHVSLRDYVFASAVGMLPATVLYVFIGALLGDAALGGAQRERGTAEWVLYALGLVATIAVSVYIARVARRALKSAIASPDDDDE